MRTMTEGSTPRTVYRRKKARTSSSVTPHGTCFFSFPFRSHDGGSEHHLTDGLFGTHARAS